MQFNYKGVHRCDAVVMMCMDFRFWREVAEHIKEKGIENFDVLMFPGAAKMIVEEADACPAKKGAAIAHDLHHAKKVIIVNHADCGAYGGRSAFGNIDEERKKHVEDVKKAIEIIKVQYPDMEVTGLFADLDEEMNEINFIEV